MKPRLVLYGVPGARLPVVMLPALGVPSPNIYFKPLAQALADSRLAVVVEPLGYGLSGPAQTPRTAANMVREWARALEEAGIRRFVLLAHSIAGAYGLELLRAYPERVAAFVALDITIWDQDLVRAMTAEAQAMLGAMEELEALRRRFGGEEGFRAAIEADPAACGAALPQVAGYAYTDEDAREYAAAYARAGNDTLRDQLRHLPQTLEILRGARFPAELPVLSILSEQNAQAIPAWRPAHQAQLTPGPHTLQTINAPHHLWHTALPQTARAINTWLEEQGL